MKRIDIMRSVKKQMSYVKNPILISLSVDWFDACSKVIKKDKIYGVDVIVDKTIKFMFIKA